MSEELNLVRDLAVILISAGIFTIISKALKQPLILGYIVAGFLIGPSIGFFPGITSEESVHQWSEIGIIFMMFGLGLEFSFKKLMKAGTTAMIASACKLIGMFVVGYVIGQALGWSKMESIFLGGMLPMSSTMVVVKSYDEMGLKKKPFAPFVFGTLIIEDIAGIIMMVIFSMLAVSTNSDGGAIMGTLAKLAFCLILWFIGGIYLIPTILQKTKRFLNDEILLIVSIGLCFAMVAIAESAGFSAALGAFMMGSILAETVESDHIDHLVHPIKDLFGAIFFVSVGMMVSPQVIAEHWLVILLLVVVLLVFDTIFVTGGVLLSGRGLNNAIHTGFSLAQMGEFGFIIASVGVGLGVVSDYIYPVIIAVFVISNLIAPFVIKASEPTYQILKRRLPQSVLNKIDEDQSQNVSTSNAEQSEWKKLLKAYLTRIIVYSVIIIALNIASNNYLDPLMTKIFPSMSETLRDLIVTSITLIVMAPFLYGLGFSSGSMVPSVRKLLKSKENNKWPILALLLIRSFLVVSIIVSIIAGHFHLAGWSAVLILIGGVVFVIIGRSYMKKSSAFEQKFFDNLNEKEILEKKKNAVSASIQDKLAGYDVHLERFEVPADSVLIGKKLKDIPLRAQSGANLVEITRGSRNIIIPTSDEVLYPYDKLLAVGSSAQIGALKEMFSEEPVIEHNTDEFKVACITIGPDSQLLGKSLRSASLRDYKCMVISVMRGEDFITNPKPDFHFEEGDKVWLAGEKSACEWIR